MPGSLREGGQVLAANRLTDLLERNRTKPPTENSDGWSINLVPKKAATFGLTGLLGHRIISGTRRWRINSVLPARQPAISRVR